jgi:hypothetical protein
MTTTADALEILTVVTACHHRTAPRLDDPEVAKATADLWADLLSGYDLTCTEYIEAVKQRAKSCPDAPEPADLIRVARATRQEALWRDEPEPDYHRSGDYHRSAVDPGDEKAAPDPPDYPREWTTEQRVSAYWHAVRLRAMPTTTKGWHAILKQLEQQREHRREQVAEIMETEGTQL